MEIMNAVLLLAGIAGAIVATIHAVVADGYRQVPRNPDRPVATRSERER
jgi:hypothetical protein